MPWARFPGGAREPDELRLFVPMVTPMDGLATIELGVAFLPDPAGHVPSPEVLVRVELNSPAFAAMSRHFPAAHGGAGRTASETVFHIAPENPSARATRALLERLVSVLSCPPGRDEPAFPSPRHDLVGSPSAHVGFPLPL